MLIHELRSSSWGKYTQIKENYENLFGLHDHIIEYYLEHLNLTKSELEEQLKKDIYFSPKKYLEIKLVDEIIYN